MPITLYTFEKMFVSLRILLISYKLCINYKEMQQFRFYVFIQRFIHTYRVLEEAIRKGRQMVFGVTGWVFER